MVARKKRAKVGRLTANMVGIGCASFSACDRTRETRPIPCCKVAGQSIRRIPEFTFKLPPDLQLFSKVESRAANRGANARNDTRRGMLPEFRHPVSASMNCERCRSPRSCPRTKCRRSFGRVIPADLLASVRTSRRCCRLREGDRDRGRVLLHAGVLLDAELLLPRDQAGSETIDDVGATSREIVAFMTV